MPRPIWSGSISFGLVNVPVALFSAARDLGVHFNQLHEKDAARIETRRFCEKEDKEVPYEEIGRAFDLEDGKSVVVTDEELQEVAPRRTRTIDIEAFAGSDEIDPIYFDHPYFLAPVGDSDGTRRAYQLLVEAMDREDQVAIGRFVMRTKEYLVAVQVRDGRLALTTMRWGDEIRPAKGIDNGGKKPAKAQLDQAVALIEALSADWDPSEWKDRYRERLEDVIARKRKGQTIKAPAQEQEEPSPVPDLMAALERSLAEARGGGSRSKSESKPGSKSKSKSKSKPGGKGAEARDGELAGLSREELYERAQDEDVPGRSSMSKGELIDALGG
jgi:DNA end-binding protein Ku